MLSELKKELKRNSDKSRAKLLSSFFKTGKGEYGEGDLFLGLPLPKQREISKKYLSLNLHDIQKLLLSKIHEYRLVALIILLDKYKKAEKKEKNKIAKFYLKNTKNINNWDLVDISAPKILGHHTYENSKLNLLEKLSKSKNLWEKRISIISTFYFIDKNNLKPTLKISKTLLNDKHDLIHKAVGWALREVGKKDKKTLNNFLDKHIKQLPRTTLRYSIERFPEPERKDYLKR